MIVSFWLFYFLKNILNINTYFRYLNFILSFFQISLISSRRNFSSKIYKKDKFLQYESSTVQKCLVQVNKYLQIFSRKFQFDFQHLGSFQPVSREARQRRARRTFFRRTFYEGSRAPSGTPKAQKIPNLLKQFISHIICLNLLYVLYSYMWFIFFAACCFYIHM